MTPQRRGRSITLVLALLLGCLSAHLPAGAKESAALDQYVRQFEASYHGVGTLRAEFTQTHSSGGQTRQESGTVYLARGDRMRWEYHVPESRLFVSDGKQVLFYVPAEKQLTRASMKDTGDVQAALGMLLSRVNLRNVFSQIEFADKALHADHGDRVLRAYPKHACEAGYTSVLIELTSAFDIRRLVIFYPDMSSMQFAFNHVERNVPFRSSLFEFTPPPGTEVIEQ